MQLEFNIAEQTLTMTNKKNVVADSLNYLYCKFTFSEEWNGLTKTAVFISNTDDIYNMILTNDCCEVPWEVITSPSFKVSVFGGNRITTNIVSITVTESGCFEGGASEEITPDLYTQIMEQITHQQSKCANAIEGNISGELIHIDDISPFPADAQVTVISNNEETLYKTGKNLLPNLERQVLTSSSAAMFQFENAIYIKKGVYRLSIKQLQNCTQWRLYMALWDKNGERVINNTGVTMQNISEYLGASTKNSEGKNIGFYFPNSSVPERAQILMTQNSDIVQNVVINIEFKDDFYVNFALYNGDVTSSTVAVNSQLEVGDVVTPFETYRGTSAYKVRYDGLVEGLTSLDYPVTNLYTKSAGTIINVLYTRDINKVIEDLQNAIISLGGNV